MLLPLPSMHLPQLFMWLLPRHSGLSSNTCFSKKASLTRSSQLSHVALCCVLFSIYPTVLTILLLNLFTRIYSRHLLKAYYVPGTDLGSDKTDKYPSSLQNDMGRQIIYFLTSLTRNISFLRPEPLFVFFRGHFGV